VTRLYVSATDACVVSLRCAVDYRLSCTCSQRGFKTTHRSESCADRPRCAQVREVYGAACEAEPPHELPDKDVLALAIEFAAVERDLQEIDRARCALCALDNLA
jgi:hypothetical protein